MVYEAEILSRMCQGNAEYSGYKALTSDTPNIMEWLDFGFYNLVWYFIPTNEPTSSPRSLGRWPGVSHCIGSALCYWILLKSGKVISSTSVQHVPDEEQCKPNLVAQITTFNSLINARLDDTNFTSDDLNGESPYLQDYSPPAPDMCQGIIPSDEEYGDMIMEPAPDDDEHPDLDNYIHAQLLLDIGGEQLQGHVLKMVKEPDGTKKGKAHRIQGRFSDGIHSKYNCQEYLFTRRPRGMVFHTVE